MLKFFNNETKIESDLEIKLIALEINELENYRNNMKVLAGLKEVREENQQRFEVFKKDLKDNLKDKLKFSPLVAAFAASGIFVTRSLFFGGALGIAGFCSASKVFSYYSNKNLEK